MSWQNVFKILCWVGWHVWEYVYKGDAQSNPQRCCKYCGTTQIYSKKIGKWSND